MNIAENVLRAKKDFDDVYDAGYEQGKSEVVPAKAEQEKSVTITKNGTTEVLPDEDKTLSKVTVDVDISDTFWDDYLSNGGYKNYNYAFAGECWNNDSFKPKHDIVPKDAFYMFYKMGFEGDLQKHLEDCGVKLDFSKATVAINTFQGASKITRIGVVDLRQSGVKNGLFVDCSSLKTIDKFIFTELTTSVFARSKALQDIVLEGTITGTMQLQDMLNLTADSAKSFLLCLKNYAGTTKEYSCSIVFHSNVWDLLDVEGETSPDGTTWRVYASNKGWDA